MSNTSTEHSFIHDSVSDAYSIVVDTMTLLNIVLSDVMIVQYNN